MTMQIQIEADSVPSLLRSTRGAAGLSTRAMASRIGVSHATIAKWEIGQGEPSVSQFILWARATNQPAKLMLDGLIDVVCATRDSNPQPSDPYLGHGCPCRANDYHGRGDCPFGCSCGWCAPELWDSEDPYQDAATFWSDDRALILAALWCQVEPDAESALPEAVA